MAGENFNAPDFSTCEPKAVCCADGNPLSRVVYPPGDPCLPGYNFNESKCRCESDASVYAVNLVTAGSRNSDGTRCYVIGLRAPFFSGLSLVESGIFQILQPVGSFPGTFSPSGNGYSTTIQSRSVVITNQDACDNNPNYFAGTLSGAVSARSYIGNVDTGGRQSYTMQPSILTDDCPINTPATQSISVTYIGPGEVTDWYSPNRLQISSSVTDFLGAEVLDCLGPDRPGPSA